MNFNVSQLMMGPSGSERRYEVDERVPQDAPDAPRVHGTVKLLRTDRGVWVSASLDSDVPWECVRCLARYRQSVQIVVEEEFFPQPESGARADRSEDPYREESFEIDQDHILDLTEVVRQYFALSEPMKPVCRTDCEGICLSCGTDLNQSTCGCDAVPGDSRWSPLANAVFPGETS